MSGAHDTYNALAYTARVPVPHVVIVTGPPCSGKSTLAIALARALRWPRIEKDLIKESLFDTLGSGDRDRSRELSDASFAVMLRLAQRLVSDGLSVVLEGNFRAMHCPPLRALHEQRHAALLQIVCGASPDLLLQRQEDRARHARRHPGHLDAQLTDEMHQALRSGRAEALELPGERMLHDSTAPVAQLESVIAAVEAWRRGAPAHG